MKKILLILLITQIALLGNGSDGGRITQLNDSPSKQEAEEILGQPIKVNIHKTETNDDVINKRITYAGLQNEPKTNRAVNLSYSLKKYKNAALAKNAYATIIKNNVNMAGQTSINGMGDEANYHTDGENFSLLMVVKGECLLLMKVNKMTNKFSKTALEKAVKRIILTL
ncbi:MAG: hypothetical protein V4663_12595 [Bacteroidota bacterium]